MVKYNFIAVYKNGCQPLQRYAHKKRMENWMASQTQYKTEEIEIISRETLLERRDVDVQVVTLMTNKIVTIKAGDRGGCCDPSTERYYSM